MKAARRIFVLGAIVLSGCHTAHDVAVTSFRVLDAPANFVRRRIDPPQQTTTTTTTTTAATSDVVTPGRTVTTAPATNREKPRRQVTTTESRPSPTATPHVTRNTTVEKSKPSPTPAPRSATTTQPTQYPTAKPVPGKPGYVFSPFDPSGGYVDVNGYTPGSKVKDPYSGKIFLVP